MPPVVVLLLALFFSAFAADESEPPQPGAALAEYTRLGEEIRTLSKKNAWGGVERSYQEMLATGIPPEAEYHHAGAQAARALGDLSTSRKRIELALEILDIAELQDWMRDIDTSYGSVSLQGDPGKVELVSAQTPFDPIKAAAITYAKGQITESGTFIGLLPEGTYTFGPMDIRVRPGISTVRIDIRSDKYLRKLERMERKDDKELEAAPTGQPPVDIPIHLPAPDDE